SSALSLFPSPPCPPRPQGARGRDEDRKRVPSVLLPSPLVGAPRNTASVAGLGVRGLPRRRVREDAAGRRLAGRAVGRVAVALGGEGLGTLVAGDRLLPGG